ncbi:hypothetical protein P7K49_028438 [Saguinus oedipus]|uniref:Inositol-phosphate phosphatase n=1 Tax=Saguinus oedipus TaxID=9490 RepID=A0ABQ9UCE9_SAGOE|nr:hypothetical protein P7K49_028438 [Saguinus oedipus]
MYQGSIFGASKDRAQSTPLLVFTQLQPGSTEALPPAAHRWNHHLCVTYMLLWSGDRLSTPYSTCHCGFYPPFVFLDLFGEHQFLSRGSGWWACGLPDPEAMPLEGVSSSQLHREQPAEGGLRTHLTEDIFPVFIAEEAAASGAKCVLTHSPTWIIDPIDGTCNFVHRFPTVAVSIGFAVRQEVRVQPGPQGPFLDSLWPSFLSGFSLCVLGLQFTLFLNHDWQIQACGFEI